MLRLVVYAVVALVVLGALLAGTLPNSPASAVHDAIAGWHWVAHHVQAQWQRDALQDRDVQTHSGRG